MVKITLHDQLLPILDNSHFARYSYAFYSKIKQTYYAVTDTVFVEYEAAVTQHSEKADHFIFNRDRLIGHTLFSATTISTLFLCGI